MSIMFESQRLEILKGKLKVKYEINLNLICGVNSTILNIFAY